LADGSSAKSTPSYTMGYSEEYLRSLKRRSADSNASHLLPYLKPGMSVLDFGCGPGAISVDLAAAIAPGELHGIDMTESQIEMARAAAAAGGHKNATFRVGDVTELPFEDGSFDVAHCHAVLMHVPDTSAVLAEVIRVLKPGGIISAREGISSDVIMFPPPQSPLANALASVIQANGGHPDMGKELKHEFIRAGFADIFASVTCVALSSTDEIAALHNTFRSDGGARVAAAYVKFGLGTQEDVDRELAYVDELNAHPGAFVAVPWGVAIARKP